VATALGSSSFRRADGSSIEEIIKNGTLQVRSIWQNPDDPNDINNDGRISPLDVLLLLNELSKYGARELEMPSSGEELTAFYDVDGDGHRSPKDVLSIINCLNGLGCVTTPAPILAQVTPDLEPDLPDSTGVGAPDPDNPKQEDLPPDELDPPQTIDCYSYELDEDGNPIPIEIADCDDYIDVTGDPVPVEPIEYIDAIPDPVPLNGETLDLADELLLAKSLGTSTNFATTPSSNSVDAVIVELVDELSGQPMSDELIDLGLGGLFAAS
jgi:hypothetical protein